MLNILDVFFFVDTKSVDLRRTCYRFLHRAAESISGRISKVCFPGSGGGLVGPERVVPNQPPFLVIYYIHGLNAGPVPEDCDFGGVQTPGFLEKLDSRDDLLCTRSDLYSTNLRIVLPSSVNLPAGIVVWAAEMVLPQA